VESSEEIHLLNHKDEDLATQIYSIFQQSYMVEAKLIGATDFPPLRRSVNNITLSNSNFWGLRDLNGLIGVIEIEQADTLIQICSLVTSPRLFRNGIGTDLLKFVLAYLKWQIVEVQTATANLPAIRLYQKVGFSEQKRWHSKEGIELIVMSKSNEQ
jgi:ribosomal protein S18 acetylase RimI-like enzyme